MPTQYGSCTNREPTAGKFDELFDTIISEDDGPNGTITLNRPDDGNMFTAQMCRESLAGKCGCLSEGHSRSGWEMFEDRPFL